MTTMVNYFLENINSAGMDETHCTYVDHECLDIHDFDDDSGHDTHDDTDDDIDDDTNDDTDDDTDEINISILFYTIWSQIIVCFEV